MGWEEKNKIYGQFVEYYKAFKPKAQTTRAASPPLPKTREEWDAMRKEKRPARKSSAVKPRQLT